VYTMGSNSIIQRKKNQSRKKREQVLKMLDLMVIKD